MRVAYVYFMIDEPDRVRAVAPQHAAYWRGLEAEGYLGGPFADRSGGLITFEIASAREAERLVSEDPFVLQGLVGRGWLKDWAVD